MTDLREKPPLPTPDDIEAVARAIYAEFENRPVYARAQMNGHIATELAQAAITAWLERHPEARGADDKVEIAIIKTMGDPDAWGVEVCGDTVWYLSSLAEALSLSDNLERALGSARTTAVRESDLQALFEASQTISTRHADRADRAESFLRRAVEALRPFATEADEWDAALPDSFSSLDGSPQTGFSLGLFRQAASVLAEIEKDTPHD